MPKGVQLIILQLDGLEYFIRRMTSVDGWYLQLGVGLTRGLCSETFLDGWNMPVCSCWYLQMLGIGYGIATGRLGCS